jgi:hypothetical protein
MIFVSHRFQKKDTKVVETLVNLYQMISLEKIVLVILAIVIMIHIVLESKYSYLQHQMESQ